MAHERNESVLNVAAFNAFTAQGVGTVEHDELLSVLGGCFHCKPHGTYVCERAAADVLYVVNKHIYVFKHVGCCLACLSVERINGQTRGCVFHVGNALSRMCVAAHAVFRTVKGNKLHVLCLVEYVDCAYQIVVHTGGIGNQSYALAFKTFEILVFQYFYACFNLYLLCRNCLVPDCK